MIEKVTDKRRSRVMSIRLTQPEMIRLQEHAIVSATSVSEMVRRHVSNLIDREDPVPSCAEDSGENIKAEKKWIKEWFADYQRERAV